MLYDSILGTIGKTPVVRIQRLAPKHVTMYVKCEFFNPMSSVKDRLAMAAGRGVETRSSLVAVWPAIRTGGCGPWARTVNCGGMTKPVLLSVPNAPMAQ